MNEVYVLLFVNHNLVGFQECCIKVESLVIGYVPGSDLSQLLQREKSRVHVNRDRRFQIVIDMVEALVWEPQF